MTDPNGRTPRLVGWGITNRCNLTCPHCFTASGKRSHDEMTTAECRNIIDAMAGIGVSTIGWTGGEPLLRADLEDLIDYARQKRIKSSVTTNGILLDRERAVRLTEAGNRAVQISLDGSTPERNRMMRGATDEEYDTILEAIRTCKRLENRVILATVLGRENLDDGPEMIKLARREGVDSIRFCAYAPIGRGKQSKIKKRLYLGDALSELLRIVEQAQEESTLIVDFDIGFGPAPPDYTFHQCVAGIETFYLDATGDVYPCTSLTYREFLVGNVRETPLEEIWNSSAMLKASEYQRGDIQGYCSGCDNFVNCHGACRGATLSQVGDLKASFPLCLYRIANEQHKSGAPPLAVG